MNDISNGYSSKSDFFGNEPGKFALVYYQDFDLETNF